MSEELKAARAKAEEFCAANLRECCAELAEWQNKGQLRAGRLRELGEMCEAYVGQHDGLKVAERMVERYAVELVATPTSPSTEAGGQLARKTAETRMAAGFDPGGEVMPSTAEDERAAFEGLERESNLRRVGVERDGSGGWYENPCVQSAWEGWIARAALAAHAADSEAKERDAARYQFLRQRTVAWNALRAPEWKTGAALDNAVDAAMKATQREM